MWMWMGIALRVWASLLYGVAGFAAPRMMKPSCSACDEEIPHKRAIGCLVLLTIALGGPFLLYQAACVLWPWKWALSALVGAVEWFFYVCYYRSTYEEFNKIPAKCQPKNFTPADGLRTWSRFIDLMRKAKGISFEEYIRPWFLNAPMSAIKQGNVAEMLTYGFFYRKRSEMTGDLAHIPDMMVQQLEKTCNVKFEPGYTPGLPFMSHLWENLRAHYRPLLLYLFMEVLGKATRLIMTSYGFKIKRFGLLTYYTLNCGVDFAESEAVKHIPSSTPQHEGDDEWTPFAAPLQRAASETKPNPLNDTLPDINNHSRATPVLFLHGVGGLVLYLEMLKHVIALGHPVIVIEYQHVGMRLCSYIPSVDEVTQTVVEILDAENILRVCVVGHSYGSFMASRLNVLHRDKVHSMCLVDPVCLGMFMPQLLHNFMYRRPRIDWRHPDVLVRDLALYFASRDVHLAATFARRFYWTDLNLWPDDLGPGSCIILSGNDDLCNSEGAKRMLEAGGQAKVLINPALFHGAILLDNTSKAALLVEVKALLDTSGSLVVRLARPVVDRTLSAARSIMLEVGDLTTRLSNNPAAATRQLRRTCTDLPARTWTPLVKKVAACNDNDPDGTPIQRVYLRSRSSIHTNFIHSLASLRERYQTQTDSAPSSPHQQQQHQHQQQGSASDSPLPPTSTSDSLLPPGSSSLGSSLGGVQVSAGEGSASDRAGVQVQDSLSSSHRNSRHERQLSTIPSLASFAASSDRSGGTSNRSSVSGNAELDHDVGRQANGWDQIDASDAAVIQQQQDKAAAAGQQSTDRDISGSGLDQQGQCAPASADPAGDDCVKLRKRSFSDKASDLVRRAFTSWNSPAHRQWQQQSEQEQSGPVEQQQVGQTEGQQQETPSQTQMQQEAAALQALIHQQQS